MENKEQNIINSIKESYNEISQNTDNKNLLLLVCCAPCACLIMERLLSAQIKYTVLFYNPNIMPFNEYVMRKNALKEFCNNHNIEYKDLDISQNNSEEEIYISENKKWLENVKGYEHLPEKSERCERCFSFRLNRVFQYAKENGFNIISSTLGVSIYKDINQVNKDISTFETLYEPVKYWLYNWQTTDDYKLRREIIRSENIYNQKYCGCIFSIRKKQ